MEVALKFFFYVALMLQNESFALYRDGQCRWFTLSLFALNVYLCSYAYARLYSIDILLGFRQVSWCDQIPGRGTGIRNLEILSCLGITMNPALSSLSLPFAMICLTLISGARIDKKDGGYEDIVVAINPSVQYDENIITNIKVSCSWVNRPTSGIGDDSRRIPKDICIKNVEREVKGCSC